MNQLKLCLLALVGAGILTACPTPTPPSPTIAISPTSATLTAGTGTASFAAALSNSTATIAWTISPSTGTLSAATGTSTTYTPPATVASATIITVTATAAGVTASAQITVNPPALLTQTTTFPALSEKAVGDTATLNATASSGLAVSFSSLTQATCTVATNTVTAVGAGTCTIAADQPGNATYASAPRVQNNFNICNAVILNNSQQTTWTAKFLTTGSAAFDSLEVLVIQTNKVLSGNGRDNNQQVNTSVSGSVSGCAGNLALTLTLENGGSPRGILTLTGTVGSAANQPISGTYTSNILNNATGQNETGTFTMTHN